MAVDVVRTALASGLAENVTPVIGPGGLASTGARRLLRAFDDANASIWRAARDPERHGMGTTIVALLFDPDTAVAVKPIGPVQGRRVLLRLMLNHFWAN